MSDAALTRYFLDASPSPAERPEVPRIDVYRRLVRAAFRATITNAFSDSRAALGEEIFDAMLSAFLEAGGPNTPFYRDIPGDLVAWAMSTDYLYADLLQWEWLELVAARHPAELDALANTPAPRGLWRPNPTMQLAAYARPVEEITREQSAPPAYAAPMAYLVWRRPYTDETETHKVGLLLARGLAHAASSPEPELLSVDTIADLLASETPEVDRAAILDGLHALEAELRAREGLL